MSSSISLSRAADIDRDRVDTHAGDGIAATDKRRWLSFLTWAFVLAEMASRDVFLPNSAHASDDDAGRTPHAPGDGPPIANNLPDVNISTAAESSDSDPGHKAALMAEHGPTALASELAAVKAIPVEDLGAQPGISHGGGGGGGAHADGDASVSHADDGGLSATGDLHIGEPISLSFGHDGLPLDLGLHLGAADIQLDVGHVVDGLFDTVGNTLGGLPVVGGLLHSVENVAMGAVPSLLGPVVSLVGLGSDSGTHQSHGSDTGLPGQLHFAESGNSHAPSDLSTPTGSYTSYGIAMSTDNPGGASTNADTQHDSTDTSILDTHLADHLIGSDHGASDALHFDQAVLRSAADVLA